MREMEREKKKGGGGIRCGLREMEDGDRVRNWKNTNLIDRDEIQKCNRER